MTKSGARNLLRARMKPCARMPSAPEFRARVFFISSSGARVRLSHAAFAVSKRRFPDHRSMDWCELRLFLFPERDVVVPTRRDAHQRTSEPSLSHCGPGVIFRTDRTARQQLATLGHSQGCAKLPKCRCARIYTKCCILNTREAERLSSAGWSRRGGREPSCLIDGEVVCCDEMGVAAFQLLRHRRNEPRAFLYAFDLLELNGDDLRREPIEVRKATLASTLRKSRRPFPAIRPRAPATRPCRHVRSRCTETAGSRGVCGRARAIAWRASCAPRTDDRSASSLAGRPCLIIGVRECGYETGNIVHRASVEATSVVGDRARVRRFRRIRTVRISGRPAQTAAELAGACGQAASHPRIGGTAVPSPGLSEQASN